MGMPPTLEPSLAAEWGLECPPMTVGFDRDWERVVTPEVEGRRSAQLSGGRSAVLREGGTETDGDADRARLPDCNGHTEGCKGGRGEEGGVGLAPVVEVPDLSGVEEREPGREAEAGSTEVLEVWRTGG